MQVQAFEEGQKYKEGKYILERAMLHKVALTLLPRSFCGPSYLPAKGHRLLAEAALWPWSGLVAARLRAALARSRRACCKRSSAQPREWGTGAPPGHARTGMCAWSHPG